VPSGCPTDAKTLTAARRWWKENGRNVEKTHRKTGLASSTIRAAIEREKWHEWADAVDEAKLQQPNAIQTQAEREAQILSIHDTRLRKIQEAIPTLGIDPRGAIGEVSTITKDSRLINGKSTDRHDLTGLSDDDLDARIKRLLGELDGNGNPAA